MELLERSGHIWEDNIKMHFMETGRDSVNCIHLTQDTDQWQAHVNLIVDLWVP